MNARELQLFSDAQESFNRARKYGEDVKTVSAAIDEFREASAKFEVLNQPLAAAVALTYLGAQLVNRAWSPPNLVNLMDAADAEGALSRALEHLSSSKDQSKPALEANALAWRARARTLLAEKDKLKNNMALNDAQRAVTLLSAEPITPDTKHDLALAHLHLARAHFFRVKSPSSDGVRRDDIEKVKKHSREALQLDPENRHIRIQASWLFENAEQ